MPWTRTITVYLVDANILLYAVDSSSRQHTICVEWLESALNGHHRVGLPAQSIAAFLRISTHPRVMERPLTAPQSWGIAESWLAAPAVWVPTVTARTLTLLGELMVEGDITGNLIQDAQLAALALEHGSTIVTTDTDFARFPVSTLNSL